MISVIKRQVFLPLLLFVSFFLPLSNANAQPVLKWSPRLEDNSKMPYLRILGSTADGFVVLRSNISLESGRDKAGFRSRKYLLQYFSESMVLTTEHELSAPVEDGKITDVDVLNGQVIIIYYVSIKGSDAFNFYAARLNKQGKSEIDPVFLDTLHAESIDDENKPGIVFSKDNSRLLFAYRRFHKDGEGQELKCVVLDNNLSVVYKHGISVPYSYKRFVPLTPALTDEGSVYVLGVRYTTDKKVKAPGEMYFSIYGYSRQFNKDLEKEIKLDGKFVSDVSLSIDALNKQLVVAGFYSDKTTYSAAGIFYYAMGMDSLNETRIYSSAFSKEYLQKFIADRKDAKTKELVNYSIDRIILRRDGGAVVAAESYYRTSRSYWDYYTQTMVYHVYYHYGNIMIVSVNPDGSMLWSNLVSKDQNSVDDGAYYSSYASAIAYGKMYAIYNKYIDDRSSVLITTTEGSGAQKTDVLFNEVDRVTLLSKASKQLDEDTLVIPAYRERNFYFLKVVFE